jgi:HlyD family secretion protein
MQAPSRQTLFLAFAALAVAALGWMVFRPSPLRVDVASVHRGDREVTVDEEGETRVRERYVVAAPTSGRLLRVLLEEGDAVSAGGLVARIEAVPLDPRDRAAAEARLEGADARLSAANARAGLARATREQAIRSAGRAERLRDAGTVSEEAFEQAQLALTQATRDLEATGEAAHAAEHEVEAARAALIDAWGSAPPSEETRTVCPHTPCVEVRAPVEGRVLRVLQESERIVTAGTPLVEIGQPSDLEIVVDVLSTDAVRIRPGAPVRIVEWGGQGELTAAVRRVEPSAFTKVSALGVEEQRVNVVADLREPAAGLGDGFRVEARIQVWEGSDLVLVPASALFRAGEHWAVFVVEAGVARRREVEVGERGEVAAEIRGNLLEGETVILHPSDQLADGARVEAG